MLLNETPVKTSRYVHLSQGIQSADKFILTDNPEDVYLMKQGQVLQNTEISRPSYSPCF